MAPKFLFAAMLVALSATVSAQVPAPVVTEKYAVRDGFAFSRHPPIKECDSPGDEEMASSVVQSSR